MAQRSHCTHQTRTMFHGDRIKNDSEDEIMDHKTIMEIPKAWRQFQSTKESLNTEGMSALGPDSSSTIKIRKWLQAMNDRDRDPEVSVADYGTKDLAPHMDPNCNRDTVSDISRFGSIVTIMYSNGDYFRGESTNDEHTERYGTLFKMTCNETKICGTWKHDVLVGQAIIESPCSGTNYGEYRNGREHGIHRVFVPTLVPGNALRLVACFFDGVQSGLAWKGLVGGSFLVGPLDQDGNVSGPGCLYIYPDLSTVVVGSFQSDCLIEGCWATIEDFDLEHEILIPKVGNPTLEHGFLFRDVSTRTCISKLPLVQDFWESKRVEVSPSRIGDHAGEGVFAKIDFLPGDLICLYNGIRYRSSREDEGSDYCIKLNTEVDIDIPDASTHLSNYSATSGHKCNHSFAPNAKWATILG